MKITVTGQYLGEAKTSYTDKKTQVTTEKRYFKLLPEDSDAIMKIKVDEATKAPKKGETTTMTVDMKTWEMNGKSGVTFKLE